MIEKETLKDYYIKQRYSVKEIADMLGCSAHKITYYMDKYGFKRRSISEAIYQKHNPEGDPFQVRTITSKENAYLLGLGLGLFWGEGNKVNKYSIRLGNTDPKLLKRFMNFLIKLLGVPPDKLRFGLQLFSDIDEQIALAYWTQKLEVNASQFYKVTVTISGSLGTYRKKSAYGVVTVYYHNKKLRDILMGMLP